MVLEREILPYLQWLLQGESGWWGALPHFLSVVLGISLLALLLGYCFAAARHGFLGGGDQVYRVVSSGFRELTEMSWRRIWALAYLAIKEARQRRVVVVLVVFAIVLLFASWFLKTDHQDPAKLFISFVLTATTYLLLGIALLLSAFSLPGDFKTKTIYTVVTKPVRSGEIILGRIIGFSLVGTFLLVLMAVCSYIFVNRTLSHTHRVEGKSLERVTNSSGEFVGYDGTTTRDAHHRHKVELSEEGSGALSNFGHHHSIESHGDVHEVQAAEGYMRARVPYWGDLRFLDRQGVPKEKGISVGNEWGYRSFIDGNTLAAAIWTFDNISPPSYIDDPEVEEFEKGLPIGLIVRVFRTHKGIIGQQISGTIQVRNPETDLRSDVIHFWAVDAKVDEHTIPRKLISTDGVERDLYKDFVSKNGEIEIVVRCLERGQYFGFAKADCYVQLPDGSPLLNFAKVCASIWVQMVIVISIGVATSAFLSGPVAMLFTVAFIILGFFREFFVGVASGTEYGGGPLESLVRLVTHKNLMVKLDSNRGTWLIEGIDFVLEKLMFCVAQVLPDFSAFSTVDFAAYGFDVPTERVWQDLTTCLAYIVGLATVGYFLLRTREVAR
ncbi:MAG: hypothetical protein MI725_16155 [Pirellulales bacterium]|nr:hypothetical protein [Pirellulales bacterium]